MHHHHLLIIKKKVTIVLVMVVVTITIATLPYCAHGGEVEHHRTKAAAEKQNDLFCFKCDTIVNGDACLDLKRDNSSALQMLCAKDQRICQVQRITISTNNDQQQKLWLLQRNCTKNCDAVCVTIGERTKLRACNTCCETNYCNVGNTATCAIYQQPLNINIYMLTTFQIIIIKFIQFFL